MCCSGDCCKATAVLRNPLNHLSFLLVQDREIIEASSSLTYYLVLRIARVQLVTCYVMTLSVLPVKKPQPPRCLSQTRVDEPCTLMNATLSMSSDPTLMCFQAKIFRGNNHKSPSRYKTSCCENKANFSLRSLLYGRMAMSTRRKKKTSSLDVALSCRQVIEIRTGGFTVVADACIFVNRREKNDKGRSWILGGLSLLDAPE